jgi:spore germination protein YaaH
MKLTNIQQDLVSKSLIAAKITKNQKKEERQQELKNLLMNTVNLTKLLEEQIKIFKMKGIYGSENI